jgi:hypothetical protein
MTRAEAGAKLADEYASKHWSGDDYTAAFDSYIAGYQAALTRGAGANYPEIPDGWQLVPKLPTEAMLDAGHDTGCTSGDGTIDEWISGTPEEIYTAMLAAAPQPPALDRDAVIEACAKVAESQYHPTTLYYGERQACLMVAAAIRAMKGAT